MGLHQRQHHFLELGLNYKAAEGIVVKFDLLNGVHSEQSPFVVLQRVSCDLVVANHVFLVFHLEMLPQLGTERLLGSNKVGSMSWPSFGEGLAINENPTVDLRKELAKTYET
jgi:hypothetical protein